MYGNLWLYSITNHSVGGQHARHSVFLNGHVKFSAGEIGGTGLVNIWKFDCLVWTYIRICLPYAAMHECACFS